MKEKKKKINAAISRIEKEVDVTIQQYYNERNVFILATFILSVGYLSVKKFKKDEMLNRAFLSKETLIRILDILEDD